MGTLVNAYLAKGGRAQGIRVGTAYVDVGTLYGYREAINLLSAGSPVTPTSADHEGNRAETMPAKGFTRG